MKSAILLETGDIKGFSRCCYVFSAAGIDRAHFPVQLPKVRWIFPHDSHHRNYGEARAKNLVFWQCIEEISLSGTALAVFRDAPAFWPRGGG